ncbi:alpha/beta hydrolase [Iamia majanohamensis]|uniref:Alpha/beta hydrolase n=1 Tax=Iamia majanohamensis TaxID=467976 RepID=A0AAF0BXC4_9ACTN|nr:alpha/beta hydrolase [Iamia majanohamensis]WCO68920.1 alpha/beta hydrolase [Iamia majanohamensis]
MIVFVHGVPETAATWRKVREAVAGESVALALPGFGCPVPDGFVPSKEAYLQWLLGELDALDGPIDLVGHDWGAGLTYPVASHHGDRLRSWVADVGNIAHPDYVWHDFARLWQTPGDGEAFFAAQEAQSVDERAAGYATLGLDADDAHEMAAAGDATMGRCILGLYRSAVPNPHADWGPWAPSAAPGMVLHPTDDPFSDATLAAETAEALGARFATLDGAGHFWPYQAPEQGAAALEAFWASLD